MTGKVEGGTLTIKGGGLVITVQLGILIAVTTGVIFVVRLADTVARDSAQIGQIAVKVEQIEPRLVRIETQVESLAPRSNTRGPNP